jgi:hypothetical protein
MGPRCSSSFSGAQIILAGIVYLGAVAIWGGPLSRGRHFAAAHDTLEPAGRAVTAFELARTWPGVALIVMGALMLARAMI